MCLNTWRTIGFDCEFTHLRLKYRLWIHLLKKNIMLDPQLLRNDLEETAKTLATRGYQLDV
ncbi:MAG: hypothetical protein KDI59_10340, partial [Xanthomonadales bacterium]|nr:hypothetical protein [Xanthomonadales bacterium]